MTSYKDTSNTQLHYIRSFRLNAATGTIFVSLSESFEWVYSSMIRNLASWRVLAESVKLANGGLGFIGPQFISSKDEEGERPIISQPSACRLVPRCRGI